MITKDIKDPDNTPFIPYKVQIVATEMLPHFIKNPSITTNDIRLHMESAIIQYGKDDVIPLKKLFIDGKNKRLPEDVLRNLKDHHPLFGEKSYSYIEGFVENISATGGFGTCVLKMEDDQNGKKQPRGNEQGKLYFKRAFVVSRAGKCAAGHFLPMMFMDFAHMRNSSCEKSVIVSMLDGNGRSTPIAYGICEAEKKETWCLGLGMP